MNRRSFLVRRYFFAPAGGWAPPHRDLYRQTLKIIGCDYDFSDCEISISRPSVNVVAIDLLTTKTLRSTYGSVPLLPVKFVDPKEWEEMLAEVPK